MTTDVDADLDEPMQSALRAGIDKARARASQVGPLSALWDVIFDAEALLKGQPTLLHGSPREQAKACLAMLNPQGKDASHE